LNAYSNCPPLILSVRGIDKSGHTRLHRQLLPIDLLLYVKHSFLEQAKAGRSAVVAQYADPASRAPRVDGDGRYLNRVRLAGVKFWLDGSMDNAFMSQPYTNNPPGNTENTFRGLAVDPQAAVEATVATYWKSKRQVAGHSIGDQAVDNFLVAIEKAYAAQGPADHRPIIQHAQFLRPDQIARAKKVGAITSFTAGGIYPMGDYLARLMGPERVAWAGAAGSVQRAGIPWTMHHDMPAGVSPSLIYALWNIVNRTTKSGVVLSPQEKVSAYDGLRAITINGAYQFHEEKNQAFTRARQAGRSGGAERQSLEGGSHEHQGDPGAGNDQGGHQPLPQSLPHRRRDPHRSGSDQREGQLPGAVELRHRGAFREVHQGQAAAGPLRQRQRGDP
jgi:hypothetical protein